jgi:CspA family cold shock protein
MNFRDTLITCQECSKQFIFTVETQRKLSDSGQEVTAPELCTDCTQRIKYGGQLHGRVKWFSLEKGYGFLVQDSGSEVFFHRDGIVPTDEGVLPSMEEGQEVLYEVMDTSRGPQAYKVTPYSG